MDIEHDVHNTDSVKLNPSSPLVAAPRSSTFGRTTVPYIVQNLRESDITQQEHERGLSLNLVMQRTTEMIPPVVRISGDRGRFRHSMNKVVLLFKNLFQCGKG